MNSSVLPSFALTISQNSGLTSTVQVRFLFFLFTLSLPCTCNKLWMCRLSWLYCIVRGTRLPCVSAQLRQGQDLTVRVGVSCQALVSSMLLFPKVGTYIFLYRKWAWSNDTVKSLHVASHALLCQTKQWDGKDYICLLMTISENMWQRARVSSECSCSRYVKYTWNFNPLPSCRIARVTIFHDRRYYGYIFGYVLIYNDDFRDYVLDNVLHFCRKMPMAVLAI